MIALRERLRTHGRSAVLLLGIGLISGLLWWAHSGISEHMDEAVGVCLAVVDGTLLAAAGGAYRTRARPRPARRLRFGFRALALAPAPVSPPARAGPRVLQVFRC
jgi:hypothetical protein